MSFYYIWQFDIYTHEAYTQMNDDLVWHKYSPYNGREKKARSSESVIKTGRNLQIAAGRTPKRRRIGGDEYSRVTESLARSSQVARLFVFTEIWDINGSPDLMPCDSYANLQVLVVWVFNVWNIDSQCIVKIQKGHSDQSGYHGDSE